MGRMTDESSAPVDLSIKRKHDVIDESKISQKKKSRHHTNGNEPEIPLDLSVKSTSSFSYPRSTFHSTSTIPFYDPTNLFFNSSALLYDLFLANLNSYCQQQQQQQQQQTQQAQTVRAKYDFSTSSMTKSTKSSSRTIKETPMATSTKQECYACSCGEKYSNVAQLVSHLKMTNHSAQLSSTHDEVAKLVRGQDIWLSRDTNPANQILKCLRCSLSFETLPDLTAHMMKTNHFTQLLPSSTTATTTTTTTTSSSSSSSLSNSSSQHSTNSKILLSSPNKSSSHISSRSTCLVCSQQFHREVDLVDHLQRLHQIRFNCTTCGMYFENENLYKEHLLKEMHHRNGKSNRNRDYFFQQCKTQQKSPPTTDQRSERTKCSSPIDKEIERLASDLLDRVCSSIDESNGNALSLLQNFVRKQTPVHQSQQNSIFHSVQPTNETINDENSNQSLSNFSETASISSSSSHSSSSHHHPSRQSIKSSESPLASLEKMLAYPTTTTTTIESTNTYEHGTKKKKFDKYRLFAEKMLRSSLS